MQGNANQKRLSVGNSCRFIDDQEHVRIGEAGLHDRLVVRCHSFLCGWSDD